jgi:hypothetical protein
MHLFFEGAAGFPMLDSYAVEDANCAVVEMDVHAYNYGAFRCLSIFVSRFLG